MLDSEKLHDYKIVQIYIYSNVKYGIAQSYNKLVMTMIRPTDYAFWICQIFHYQKMQHNHIIRHAKNAYMQACNFCNISKPIMLLHLKFSLHSNKIKNCSQHASKTFNREPQLIQI
jgi:hypothetical protein